jgi:hypothetical protein
MLEIKRIAVGAVAIGMLVLPATATAFATPVSLGSAATFAVLGGATVTSNGLTVVSGDLGVSPGSAVTGFPPGILIGTLSTADPVAAQAQIDLGAAYDDAAAPPTPSSPATWAASSSRPVCTQRRARSG